MSAMPRTAIIIDDDRIQRRTTARILEERLSLRIIEAENGRAALRILETDGGRAASLAVLDLAMPVMGGMEALRTMRRICPALPVIVMTGTTDTAEAAQAMKEGAADFLAKPVEAERLAAAARNALKISSLSAEVEILHRRQKGYPGFCDLIGHDGGLAACIETGRRAAASALPVLISGETGTGKELFAQAIHGESSRRTGPFVAVNCGAIPENLVESTLFGHEKGAFTGAVAKAAGKFRESGGGTLFLDEIGELAPEAQVKLLRALQQREVEPVGAARPVAVDVRVISATNRDLAAAVRQGRFREDLYFRLNVLALALPPLRARKEDIPALARRFVALFCASYSIPHREITAEALDKLCRYNWPGNVRELENALSRAMALGDGSALQPGDFALSPETAAVTRRAEGSGPDLLQENGAFKSLKTLEREIIARALAHHGGNRARTARALGIAKSTLYARLTEER